MINKNKTFQQGQTLPLTLVLLVIVASTVFFMFNSGQLVQEKMRLTNTADAVAYSAGVYEARVLNYDAYTNRALIANEIAIGQAVGLASWAKYAGVSADNLSPYAYLIPYVGSYIADLLQDVKDAVDDVLLPALAYAVTAHDGAIQALKASPLVVHGPNNAIALLNRKLVMDEVAKQNDPDVVVDLLPISDNFMGFTKRYKDDERTRMKNVVNESRDTFLKSRNWSTPNICFVPILKKRGATELIGFEGWKSMDTLSLWYPKPKWYNPCRRKELPIGYGTAFSKNGLNDSPAGSKYGGSIRTNPNASGWANSSYGQATGFAPPSVSHGAIPEFYDLSADALTQADPRTYMTVRVTKAKSKQHYSGGNSIIKPTGQLDAYRSTVPKTTDATGIGYNQNVSAAMAKVEVFFERPDGANNVANGNNKAEVGSLFNPYWQVHLTPVSPAERAIALVLQN